MSQLPQPPINLGSEAALTVVNLSGIATFLKKVQAFPPLWNEMDGYKETWAPDGSNIERWYRGNWNTSAGFKDYMVGTASTNPPAQGSSNGVLTRTIPHQHPIYPWMYCLECEFPRGEGLIINDPLALGPDGNPIKPMITYINASDGTDNNCAVARCSYRAVDYEIRSDDEMTANGLTEINRYVSRYSTFATQALPLPGSELIFAAGQAPGNPATPASLIGQTVPFNGALLILPSREITYVWHQVPDVPWDAIDACQETLNSAAFDPQIAVSDPISGSKVNVGGYRQKGYAAGTLRMLPPDVQRHRSAQGAVTWEIVYKFIYRPQGHNNFPAADGNFYPCIVGTNGQPMFKSSDFSQLFTQPWPPVNYQGPGSGAGVPPG